MKVLLIDEGHPGSPIMAIATLSSAVSVLRARDAWIGWPPQRRDPISWKRLAFVMDLSTCIGIPPYAALTSAKLLAHLMVSRECMELYWMRYTGRVTNRLRHRVDQIALITTTGAFKTKTPTYYGIEVRGNPVFRLIGKTAGYSSAHIPDGLYRELVVRLGASTVSAVRRRGAHVRFNNLRIFARILGLDEDLVLRAGQRRSVYVAEVATNARAFLRGETDVLALDPPDAKSIIEYWRVRWLYARASKPHVLSAIRATSAEDMAVTAVVG